MPYLNLTESLGTYYSLYYNTSYNVASQPPYMTTPTVWLIFCLTGIILLLFSRHATEPTCRDLSGVMASMFLLVSAIQSFAVDTITGTASAWGTDAPVAGIIVDTHTVYHYDLIGAVFFIIWIISIANLYLLWLDHKRITDQPQERLDMRMPRKQAQMKPDTGDDDDEE